MQAPSRQLGQRGWVGERANMAAVRIWELLGGK